MRTLQHLSGSLLDFIENTRTGSALFQAARFAVFGAGVLVVSRMASAQFLSLSLEDIVFMAATALAFLVVLWRREVGILMILATTSFIAYYDVLPTLSLYHFIPEIPILEDLRLYVGQGLMLYLLGIVAMSLDVRTARARLATPMTPAVLLFLLAIVVASIGGIVFGDVRLPKMVETARPYSFYLMFFVALLCVRGRREMRILEVATLVMALVVALLMIVQFGLGDRAKVFLGESVRVEQFGGYAGRILPPGVELIWIVVPFVIARIPIASRRAARVLSAGLGLLLAGLLLTFTRSVWLGTLLSMGIMGVLGRGAVRRGVLRMFLMLAASVALVLVLLNLVSTERENYMTPYIKRFTSIFDPSSYEEGSTANVRWEEIQAAWPSVVEHPWLGIGVGGFYDWEDAWDDRSQHHYLRPVSYIHNAYMLILTQAGLLGLSTCLIMYATFFVRAHKLLQRATGARDRARIMAAIGAIAAVLLASLMQPSLWYPPAVPLIGVAFAWVELVRYFAEREARDWSANPAGGVRPASGASVRVRASHRARSASASRWAAASRRPT